MTLGLHSFGFLLSLGELCLLSHQSLQAAGEPRVETMLKGAKLEAHFDASYPSSREVVVDLILKNETDKPFVPAPDGPDAGLLVPTYAWKRNLFVPHIGWESYITASLIGPDGMELAYRTPSVKSRSHGDLTPGQEYKYRLDLAQRFPISQVGEYRCSLSLQIMELEPMAKHPMTKRLNFTLPAFCFRVESIDPAIHHAIEQAPVSGRQWQKRNWLGWILFYLTGIGSLVFVVTNALRKKR